MDISEIARQFMEPAFLEAYNKQKDEIIAKLQSNPDKCELNITALGVMALLDVKDNPEAAPDPITITDNGIKMYSWTEEIVDELINAIPTSVKELSLSGQVFKLRPNILERFPNIETLNLTHCGEIKQSDIEDFKKFPNLKTIRTDKSIDENLKFLNNINIVSSDKTRVEIDGLYIESTYNSFPGIVYNGPVDKMKDYITPEVVDANRYGISLYRNGKKILSYSNFSKEITYVLSDPLEESYNILSEFIKCTGLEYSKIVLVTENMTYSDMDHLKKFESLGNIEIDYNATTKSNIDQFIQMRANLDYFVSLINQNDLSPMEKVCYAYDLIKSYVYRENEENRETARYIHNIIDTGDIVCVGYATFLAELLKEVGIDAHAIGTVVPLGDGKDAGHERNIIEIHDDKYGVDGMFALDCTWDSNRPSYKVLRDGEELLVKKLQEGDEVLYTNDVMSSYNYFLIPAQEYEAYFPGEAFHRDVKDWNGKEYDPDKAAVDSLPELLEEKKVTEDKFEDAYIDEDTIISVIYNTRLCEGYSKEQNDRLIEEVKHIRNSKRPKELRSEDGMIK